MLIKFGTCDLIFSKDPHPYSALPAEGVVVNWIGLLIVAFCAAVLYLAVTPRFRRVARAEDEVLLRDSVVTEE